MTLFLKRHKKIFCAAGSVLLVALLFLISGTPAFVSTAAARKKLPIYSVQRDDKRVSLTFDAAWGDVRVRQAPSGRIPGSANGRTIKSMCSPISVF